MFLAQQNLFSLLQQNMAAYTTTSQDVYDDSKRRLSPIRFPLLNIEKKTDNSYATILNEASSSSRDPRIRDNTSISIYKSKTSHRSDSSEFERETEKHLSVRQCHKYHQYDCRKCERKSHHRSKSRESSHYCKCSFSPEYRRSQERSCLNSDHQRNEDRRLRPILTQQRDDERRGRSKSRRDVTQIRSVSYIKKNGNSRYSKEQTLSPLCSSAISSRKYSCDKTLLSASRDSDERKSKSQTPIREISVAANKLKDSSLPSKVYELPGISTNSIRDSYSSSMFGSSNQNYEFGNSQLHVNGPNKVPHSNNEMNHLTFPTLGESSNSNFFPSGKTSKRRTRRRMTQYFSSTQAERVYPARRFSQFQSEKHDSFAYVTSEQKVEKPKKIDTLPSPENVMNHPRFHDSKKIMQKPVEKFYVKNIGSGLSSHQNMSSLTTDTTIRKRPSDETINYMRSTYKIPKLNRALSRDSEMLFSQDVIEKKKYVSTHFDALQESQKIDKLKTLVASDNKEQPEKLLQNLKEVFGTEAFAKIQSCLVQDTMSGSKAKQQMQYATHAKPERVETVEEAERSFKQKLKIPEENSKILKSAKAGGKIKDNPKCVVSKKKLSELDRLHEDIRENICERNVFISSGRRPCTLKKSSPERSKVVKIDEVAWFNKFKLRHFSIILHKLNLSSFDMPFKIGTKTVLEHQDLNLALEQHGQDTSIHKSEDQVSSPPSSSTPHKKAVRTRKRARWSHGVIIKKKRANRIKELLIDSDDEWKDCELDNAENPTSASGRSAKIKLKQLVSLMNSFEMGKSSSHLEKLSSVNNSSKLFSDASKLVDNMSYSIYHYGTIFKCELCASFKSSETGEFSEHLQNLHGLNFWSGFCSICNKTIEMNQDLRLLREFQHLTYHLKSDNTDTINELAIQSPVSKIRPLPNDKTSKRSIDENSSLYVNADKETTFLKTLQPNQETATSKSQHLAEANVGKVLPTVRIPLYQTTISKETSNMVPEVFVLEKKLPVSSDLQNLNNSSPKNDSIGSIYTSIPNINTAGVSGAGTERQVVDSKAVYSELSDRISYDVLRPWLQGSKNSKHVSLISNMLTQTCLTALYKCMGSTCCFFTINETLFKKHLNMHQNLQPEDSLNHLSCSYCLMKAAKTPEMLCRHILDEHAVQFYQCNYCFYRSVNEFQTAYVHQSKFHKSCPKAILICDSNIRKNRIEEITSIKKILSEFIPPMKCLCKSKIIFSLLFWSFIFTLEC